MTTLFGEISDLTLTHREVVPVQVLAFPRSPEAVRAEKDLLPTLVHSDLFDGDSDQRLHISVYTARSGGH